MTTNLIKLPLSTQNTKAKVYSTILPGFLILYYSAWITRTTKRLKLQQPHNTPSRQVYAS